MVHAATLDGQGSGLRRQCQHREHFFELSTHESLHSTQLSLVHGCAQCSGERVSSSSVSTAHMSFDFVRVSVTVDSSSFAVSLFLGDSMSFTSVTKVRSATMRKDHQIRVCDVLSVSGSFVSVACSGAMCSCVRSSHPRPSHCVGTGVPWVSMPGPPVCPPMRRQDGIGDKAPTLWHAHSTICKWSW